MADEKNADKAAEQATPKQNFYYEDPETGKGTWFGLAYPENGNPPPGVVRNQAVFETPAPEDLTPREVLEADADPTRAGSQSEGVERRGVAGADETGDRSRTDEGSAPGPLARNSRNR